MRHWMMCARFFRLISLGSRPRRPGMLTTSFSLFSAASALPKRVFSVSAWSRRMEQPILMSSVITLPPKGITAVWRMMWSLKMAMSVVPPPMSTSTTPASFSSALSTASALASGSRISSVTSSPARCTHLLMLRAAVSCPLMMWKLASRRTPLMPIGSLMPCSLSMMYSCGITWMISSPGGITSLYMSSISASMSVWRISSSRLLLWRVIMPRWCMLRMCCPAMPTFTVWMSTPALFSASRTATLMLSTVFWMLLTTPRFTPSLLALPIPRISILPWSFLRPTMQAILVVPMSSPATMSFCCCWSIWAGLR